MMLTARTVELQEVVRFASGGTPSKSNPANWGGDVPWVSAKDLKTLNLHDSQDHLTKLGAKGTNLAPAGSILVLVRGMTLLKDLPISVTMRPMAFNQDVKALYSTDGLRPYYLAHYLISRKQEILQSVETAGHGTGRLDTDYLKTFPIELPSLDKQDDIIKVIGEWDAAIEKATALLTALEQRKQGLMQQLLTGRRRLKGFKGNWKTVRLNKFFEEVTRTSVESLPVMSISAGRGFLLQSERFNRVQAGKNLKNYIALFDGEFAYNKGNSKTYHCGCIYMMRGRKQAAVPNVYIAFRARTQICPEFFEFYFEADLLKQQLRRIINSGVRNDGLLNLNTEDFFLMTVRAPDIQEQAAVAQLLQTATDEIQVLGAHLVQLKTQKRALMQKLLSGNWRMPKTALLEDF